MGGAHLASRSASLPFQTSCHFTAFCTQAPYPPDFPVPLVRIFFTRSLSARNGACQAERAWPPSSRGTPARRSCRRRACDRVRRGRSTRQQSGGNIDSHGQLRPTVLSLKMQRSPRRVSRGPHGIYRKAVRKIKDQITPCRLADIISGSHFGSCLNRIFRHYEDSIVGRSHPARIRL